MTKKRSFGFTLIELIVVVAIIILLSGASLAAYFQFSQRQSAMNDARNLATMLRRVQAMAKNMVYPADSCTGLKGYRLYSDCDQYDDTCRFVSAGAVCNEGEKKVIDAERIFEKASFSEPITISFGVGSGAVSKQIEFPVRNIADAFTLVVIADTNGNVSIKEYETYD